MDQNTYVPADNIQRPVIQLKTNRKLWKLIVFSILTLGIYAIVFYSKISTDINIIASKYDGKRTMDFCIVVFLLPVITLGIAPIVWNHKLSNRIGEENSRRCTGCIFGAFDFWLWSVLGSVIIIGPLIYIRKLCEAFNLIAEDYNVNG